MRLRWLASIPLALVLVVVPASTALAQPGNDDLAGAIPVTALPFSDTVDTSDATLESGEPNFACAPVHATVWYALTLNRKGSVTIDTAGSDYDTVLAVYHGTDFADFDLVTCNDDFTGLQARASFQVAAGETYFVQVGAFGEEEFGSAGGQLEITFSRGSRAPSVFSSSFRGSQAVAEWFSADESSFSDTFVLLTDGRLKSGPGRPTNESVLEVYHFAQVFDPATDTFMFTDLFGVAVPQSGQFAIDRRLNSAYIDLDMVLNGVRCEFSTEDPGEEEYGIAGDGCEQLTAEVTVSVIWEGHGGIITSAFIERARGDDFNFRFQSRSASRDAIAGGSITGDVALVSGPADFALLIKGASSFMEWVRTG